MQHYHYLQGKRVGLCVDDCYYKFGSDILRKTKAIGVAKSIIEDLLSEGCKTLKVGNVIIPLKHFAELAEPGTYPPFEDQLFVHLRHWSCLDED